MVEGVWRDFAEGMQRPLCLGRVVFEAGVGDHRTTSSGLVARTEGMAVSGPLRKRVTLDAALQGPGLGRVVAHELCHIASFQHDLAEHAPPMPEGAQVVPGYDYDEEAFASWCGSGAFGAALLAQMEGLSTEESRVAQFLVGDVWHPLDLVAAPARIADEWAVDDLWIRWPSIVGFTVTEDVVLRTQGGSLVSLDMASRSHGPLADDDDVVVREPWVSRERRPHLYNWVPLGPGWVAEGTVVTHMRLVLPSDTWVGLVVASDLGHQLAPRLLHEHGASTASQVAMSAAGTTVELSAPRDAETSGAQPGPFHVRAWGVVPSRGPE